MKLDSSGAIIDSVTGVDASVYGSEYIVMWDKDRIPIHIHKDVIKVLCDALAVNPKPTEQPTIFPELNVDFSDHFLDDKYVE